MRQLAISIALAATFCILPIRLMAIDLGPGRSSASFRYGRMSSGDYKKTSTSFGQESSRQASSISFGGAFDLPIAQNLHVGLATDMCACSGIDITVNLKGLIASSNGKIAFRPGVGVGGAAAGNKALLTIRAFAELQMSVSRQFGIGLETGVWYTPSGGDEVYSIRIGPLTYVRGMVLFSSGSNRPRRSFERRHSPLPFRAAIKAGLMNARKHEANQGQTRKWTDRGLSVGISADSPAPLLAFLGAAVDWYRLGDSEQLFSYGFRGSFISELSVGPVGLRPVGLIGAGHKASLGHYTHHMVYGLSLETFFSNDSRPGGLLEVQYLKVSDGGGNGSAELKPLVIFRLGMIF